MYDLLVIGAGITGSLLTYKLRTSFPELKILNFEIDKNYQSQTYRSQFYIHRGHFYQEVGLMKKLNDSYNSWIELFMNLSVKVHDQGSYVGFMKHDDLWIQKWQDVGLPFQEIAKNFFINRVAKTELKAVYTFPHALIEGKELMYKLLSANQSAIKYEDIADIHYKANHYQIRSTSNKVYHAKKIVICAGDNTQNIIEKIKDIPLENVEVQRRKCQVLTLYGDLPHISMLVPDVKLFINSQHSNCQNTWVCTYDTDPVFDHVEEKYVNWNRFSNQLDQIQTSFPNILNLVQKFEVRDAVKVESKALGNGGRPNDVFIKALNNDIMVCLPTKLSLAFIATKRIIQELNFN